jgi:hypothetical protein
VYPPWRTEGAASQEDWTVGFASVTEGAASQEDWTAGFASVTKDTASQEDWIAGFSLVTKGATSQEDWSVVAVADPVWETKILPGDLEILWRDLHKYKTCDNTSHPKCQMDLF